MIATGVIDQRVEKALLRFASPRRGQGIGGRAQRITAHRLGHDLRPRDFGGFDKEAALEKRPVGCREAGQIGGLAQHVPLSLAAEGAQRLDQVRLRNGAAHIDPAQRHVLEHDTGRYPSAQHRRHDAANRVEEIADVVFAHPAHGLHLLGIDRDRVLDDHLDVAQFGRERVGERQFAAREDIAEGLTAREIDAYAVTRLQRVLHRGRHPVGIRWLEIRGVDIDDEIRDIRFRVLFPQTVGVGDQIRRL